MKFTKISNRCYFNPKPEMIFEATKRGIHVEEFDLSPIHVQIGGIVDNWILWENGKVTHCNPLDCPDCLVQKTKKREKPPADLPEDWNYNYTSLLNCLSQPAVLLINQLDGADIGEVEGSIETITEIEEILCKKDYLIGPKDGEYAGKELKEYTVRLRNGQLEKRYLFSIGYFEGYQFYVFKSLWKAKAKFQERNLSNMPVECLECGHLYDQPGHVEWGGMGCDYCNS